MGDHFIKKKKKIGHKHCKFGNFRENYIFANSFKIHICELKKSEVRHDFPISVKDKVISPFREGFVFTKLRICEVLRKQNPRKNFRIYSTFVLGEF